MPRAMVGHPNLILETLPDVCKARGWKLNSNPKHLWGENEWNKVWCRIQAPKFHSMFELQQMPGCCAVLIASYIDPFPREKNEFNLTIDAIKEAAYEAGFGSLMLSQVLHYDRLHIKKHLWGDLLGWGFKMSEPFINAKSGNEVVYLTKNLEQVGKVRGLEIPV